MPYAHDYYDHHEHPHLHNVGEGRPYLDPDWHANGHGPQLPALSSIGRGPRGEGLTVTNQVNEDGTVSFALASDLTGEVVWQSPNLDPGTITFNVPDFRDLAAGQPAPMDIIYSKGGVTKTTHTFLPCGERGSIIYVCPVTLDANTTDVYQVTAGQLRLHRWEDWRSGQKPVPKVNDIVIAFLQDPDESESYTVAFGDITAVGNSDSETVTENTPVVFVARNKVELVTREYMDEFFDTFQTMFTPYSYVMTVEEESTTPDE